MNDSAYRQALKIAKAKLLKKVEERQKLNREIAQLKDVIIANASMLPDAERDAELQGLSEWAGDHVGFTDSIRNVLRKNSRYNFNAIGIRDLLQQSGFDLDTYSNPLASIHTILRRLHERGEVVKRENTGETYYQWDSSKDVNDPNNPLYTSGMRPFRGRR
jgi:hypothetical protein